MTQNVFNHIGLPVTAPDNGGLSPTPFIAKMSIPGTMPQYALVQLNPASLDADLRWNQMVPIRGHANVTVQDRNYYGVLLQSVGTAGGRVEVGIVGDFPVQCSSGITNSIASTNSINGVGLRAHTTGVTDSSLYTATASLSLSSQMSNWLVPFGAVVTGSAGSASLGAPILNQPVLGYIISSNSVQNTSNGGTQLVRFNGFGWGTPTF